MSRRANRSHLRSTPTDFTFAAVAIRAHGAAVARKDNSERTARALIFAMVALVGVAMFYSL